MERCCIFMSNGIINRKRARLITDCMDSIAFDKLIRFVIGWMRWVHVNSQPPIRCERKFFAFVWNAALQWCTKIFI